MKGCIIMARNFNWRIKKDYYNLIYRGVKTLEVRVGYPDIKRVQKGDTITFKDYSNVRFEVIRVTRYVDFPEMLDNENSSKAIPGVSKYKALAMYQEIYPEDKESLGVYVFELRKQKGIPKIIKLSKITDNHVLFGKVAKSAYEVTDFICADYPKHFEWFWTKEIPRVFFGTAEIVVCSVNNEIAGVAFLKKEEDEKKICTILVLEKFRGNRIATLLLEESFKYLGTTKPLITIADYKLSMFESIIKKYEWQLTQTMCDGYYNNTSHELVFNGKLV